MSREIAGADENDLLTLHQWVLESMVLIMRVSPDYLEAMFDQLSTDHGSVDAYLETRLGIDAARLDTLRSHLLE